MRRLSHWRLQWGRDLIVAETVGARAIAAKRFELQWGRDLIVAETLRHLRAVFRYLGFNGAAT